MCVDNKEIAEKRRADLGRLERSVAFEANRGIRNPPRRRKPPRIAPLPLDARIETHKWRISPMARVVVHVRHDADAEVFLIMRPVPEQGGRPLFPIIVGRDDPSRPNGWASDLAVQKLDSETVRHTIC